MKTKVLVLASLLLGGFLFTSCQKDNSLMEDSATEQTFAKENYGEDPHTGDSLWVDMLRNYPDPFNYSTTIEYRLTKPAFIRLSVHQVGAGLGTVLDEGVKMKGAHTFLFSGRGLPAGEYVAELMVGGQVARETMTKVTDIDYDGPGGNY